MLRALNFQLFLSILQRKIVWVFCCCGFFVLFWGLFCFVFWILFFFGRLHSCSVTPMAVSSSGGFCHPNKYFPMQGGGGGGGGLEDPHGTFLSSSDTMWPIGTSTKQEWGTGNNADADWLAKYCYFFCPKKMYFYFCLFSGLFSLFYV